LSGRRLPVSDPACNRLAESIERGAKSQAVVREIADDRIDRRVAGPAVDCAFADEAAGIDPEAQEDLRAARPLVEQLARKIAAAQVGRDQPRRISDAIVPSSARAGAARAAAGSGADTASPGPGPGDVRRALGRRGPLARSFGRRDRLQGPGLDFRLRRDHGCRLAADILGRRAPFLLLGPGLLRLPWRR